MKKTRINSDGFATVPILIILSIIVLSGAYFLVKKEKGPGQESVSSETVMEVKEKSMQSDAEPSQAMMDKTVVEGGDAMMSKETYTGKVLAGASSPFLEFNRADYEKAVASGKLVMLYFYANWCPICREEIKSVHFAFNDLGSEGVVGFRVNYKDNETDKDEEALAREFGIAYQHTKVFIRGGDRLGKYPDSWNKERYLSEISKLISQ